MKANLEKSRIPLGSKTPKKALHKICEYAWVNGIPHKSVMPSYVDTIMKSKNIFPHNTA